jgi:hypothetical protein
MTARSGLAAILSIVALGAIAALSACERVVDVEVAEGPVRLVVEGRVELVLGAATGRQRIRLTTTDAFANNREPPPAAGARVEIADDAGRSVLLTESASEPGVYVTDALLAEVGRVYTLRIDYLGDRYEASDRLAAVPPIDTLYFVFEEANIAVGDSGFRAAIDYTDPAGRRDFYLWEQFVDGQSQIIPDPGNRFRVIRNDDFTDGATIVGYQPYDESVIEPGQDVLIRQIALSEASYRFYFALFEQAAGDQGSPFSTPPASVRGNVANLTTPGHFPLGYFVAAQVAEARGRLPNP